MKKLLIHLLLIICLKSFVSATPCLCCEKKKVSTINVSFSNKTIRSDTDNINVEITPLNIFSFRYF